MYNTVISAFMRGMKVYFVQVEADVSDGMPIFDMVGYLSSEVREAKERVRTSIKNTGIRIKPKRITINISPADIRKEGTNFDLPIAVTVLASLGVINIVETDLIIIGELGLNGEIKPIKGILPMMIEAVNRGIRKCMIPYDNCLEASIVENLEIIGVKNLFEVIQYFYGKRVSTFQRIKQERQKVIYSKDFSDVHGQEFLKRAATIAAAGFHNLLFIGPPGTGKTMIASRIPTILPELTWEECIEITKIYSVVGKLTKNSPVVQVRPFRSPHHTISPQALAGGGAIPMPGEVTLAHKGVLFLDELPEFQKASLEILRQPIEDRIINISRVQGNYEYPADCMLVAAMNPCKCGYFPDFNKCNCTPNEVRRYLGKISGPLLDRIDVCAEAKEIPYDELQTGSSEETSEQIRTRVKRAHDMQLKRYQGTDIQFNSQLGGEDVNRYCKINKTDQEFMKEVYHKMELTARSYHKILKVARTIADLEGSEEIKREHLSEAVCFRIMDKKLWTR